MAFQQPRVVPQVEGINYPDPIFNNVRGHDEECALFEIRNLARIGVAACDTAYNVSLTPDDFKALFDRIGQCAAEGLLADIGWHETPPED